MADKLKCTTFMFLQFLENADHLFKPSKNKFQARVNSDNGNLDLSLFAVKPDKNAWNHIWKQTGAKGKGMFCKKKFFYHQFT